MRKRIVVGSFEIESNSLTAVMTTRKDFNISVGEDKSGRVHVFEYLEQNGCELVKTQFAASVPGGCLVRSEFESILEDMLALFPEEGTFDGVFLCLHGAMDVEGIGSGDLAIAKAVREKIGENVPVAIAFDLHADIDPEIANYVNVVTGFRTAPHVDIPRAQQHACELLLGCIEEKYLPKPLVVKVPIIANGDSMTTDVYPGKELIEKLWDLEKNNDIMCLNIFLGNPWVDSLCAGGAVVAIPNPGREDVAAACAKELAQAFWEVRGQFRFRAKHMSVEEAFEWACTQEEGPVFMGDTGDNISGGGSGDNGALLAAFLEKGITDTLFLGITDAQVIAACRQLQPGDYFDCAIGGTLDPASVRVPVRARYIRSGMAYRRPGNLSSPAVYLQCDGIDVIVTEIRMPITSTQTFDSMGIDPYRYKRIILKLGYLWPEFYEIAKDYLMVFTRGSTCEVVEQCEFHMLPRPIYPLDKDMEWTPTIA